MLDDLLVLFVDRLNNVLIVCLQIAFGISFDSHALQNVTLIGYVAFSGAFDDVGLVSDGQLGAGCSLASF